MENKKFTSKMDRPFAIVLAAILGFVIILSAVGLLLDNFSLIDFWVVLGCLVFTILNVMWLLLNFTGFIFLNHLIIPPKYISKYYFLVSFLK